MSQSPWMLHAWAERGVAELPGAAHNARIVEYSRRLGQTWVRDDETPWCAAFVGFCLETAGVRSTRSLAARSYLEWGVAAPGPTLGAVVVLSRGGDPAAGHVGFLAGWTGTRVHLLGGNQSNAVTVAGFDRAHVLAYRLPAARPLSASPPSAPPAPPSPAPASIPPAPAAPPAAGPAPSGDPFPAALAMVLAFEGGWSDDPFDPGGPTNKGITLATYAREIGAEVTADSYGRLKAELRRIPDDLVQRIYRERYWRPCSAPDLPPPVALFHFDTAVNMGVPTAARMLQQAAGVAVDGIIGPATLAAVRAAPPLALLERYGELRRRRYRSLSIFWRFGRGWLKRLDQALARARSLAAGAPAVPPAPVPPAPPTGGRPAAPRPTTAAANPPATGAQMPDTPAPVPASPTVPAGPTPRDRAAPKWWGESLTVWGALLTGLSTVAPAVLAALGFDLPADLAQRLGRDIVAVGQAVGGLAGTLMTIAGRARATAPIQRRAVTLRL